MHRRAQFKVTEGMPPCINNLESLCGSREGIAYVIKSLMLVNLGSGVGGQLCVPSADSTPPLNHVGTLIQVM